MHSKDNIAFVGLVEVGVSAAILSKCLPRPSTTCDLCYVNGQTKKDSFDDLNYPLRALIQSFKEEMRKRGKFVVHQTNNAVMVTPS